MSFVLYLTSLLSPLFNFESCTVYGFITFTSMLFVHSIYDRPVECPQYKLQYVRYTAYDLVVMYVQ